MKVKVNVIGLIAAVIIIALVFIFFSGKPVYTGEFIPEKGREWVSVEYDVTEGNAEKFSAQINDKNRLEVTYDESGELEALIRLTDAEGKTADYSLKLYYFDDELQTTFDEISETLE